MNSVSVVLADETVARGATATVLVESERRAETIDDLAASDPPDVLASSLNVENGGVLGWACENRNPKSHWVEAVSNLEDEVSGRLARLLDLSDRRADRLELGPRRDC